MHPESDSHTAAFQNMLRESGQIAAIILFWGVLAAVSRYGIANIGFARPGQFFFELGTNLALLFVAIGTTYIFIYSIARGIQLSGD